MIARADRVRWDSDYLGGLGDRKRICGCIDLLFGDMGIWGYGDMAGVAQLRGGRLVRVKGATASLQKQPCEFGGFAGAWSPNSNFARRRKWSRAGIKWTGSPFSARACLGERAAHASSR